MEAFVGFLLILFGIAMAIGFEQILGGKPIAAPIREGLGWPVQAAALLAASYGASVIFSMPRSLLWASVLSSLVSWVVTMLGARAFPGHVVAFAAALALGLFANLCARMTKRPAQLFQLPGLSLLVPGSFGFLSLEAFLRGEFLGGAAKGFQMILIAGALVTGTLLANVLLPAKKIL